MKSINIKITEKELNFLIYVLDSYVFQNHYLYDKKIKDKLRKIYNKLNKKYMDCL